jgi:hypothetical protein
MAEIKQKTDVAWIVGRDVAVVLTVFGSIDGINGKKHG